MAKNRGRARLASKKAADALAINLDDKPHARRAEVDDALTEQRHLAPKLHAQLARLERRPQPQLGGRHRAPIGPSALLEPKLLANAIV
jgi:hypothetical protein